MLQTIDVDRIKQTIDLRDLAGHHTTLHRESGQEMAGPCPKCGGDDRFHVKADYFFCRHCYPIDNGKPHDAPAYIQWLQGADFKTACAILAGGTVPTATAPVQRPQPKAKEPQPDVWRAKSSKIVQNASRQLMNAKQGQEYLTGRGLNQVTWQAFGLGFLAEVGLPGTWNKETKTRSHPEQPAIAIPWYQNGQLVAVRYRFLEYHTYTDIGGKKRTEKQTAEYGSDFTGVLFGEQTHDPGASALVLCEGEINACSIWQVTRGMGIDVLSIGSQDAKLTQANIERIRQYDHILTWLDERGRAEAIMAVLPGAWGTKSPQGRDANDWLQTGRLEEMITRMLQRAGWAPPETQQESPPQPAATSPQVFEDGEWLPHDLWREGIATFGEAWTYRAGLLDRYALRLGRNQDGYYVVGHEQ